MSPSPSPSGRPRSHSTRSGAQRATACSAAVTVPTTSTWVLPASSARARLDPMSSSSRRSARAGHAPTLRVEGPIVGRPPGSQPSANPGQRTVGPWTPHPRPHPRPDVHRADRLRRPWTKQGPGDHRRLLGHQIMCTTIGETGADNLMEHTSFTLGHPCGCPWRCSP